jgi:hypothetical protein
VLILINKVSHTIVCQKWHRKCKPLWTNLKLNRQFDVQPKTWVIPQIRNNLRPGTIKHSTPTETGNQYKQALSLHLTRTYCRNCCVLSCYMLYNLRTATLHQINGIIQIKHYMLQGSLPLSASAYSTLMTSPRKHGA